jgi:hypothetical protein
MLSLSRALGRRLFSSSAAAASTSVARKAQNPLEEFFEVDRTTEEDKPPPHYGIPLPLPQPLSPHSCQFVLGNGRFAGDQRGVFLGYSWVAQMGGNLTHCVGKYVVDYITPALAPFGLSQLTHLYLYPTSSLFNHMQKIIPLHA